ncbi:hypothetical protein SSS_07079 [Sarcoptes scabiei]|uniref:Tudor domain-containing protein n=1 Tax=Sarcoptes scabiei TaxID=52283 RepID=A0A834RIE2_SARSC|nr:hypothetical protein SSS_07079 [Sarcoptes scabiei]
MASPKLMDKDEQLQLCIQRFVSDTQTMINQFSEVFINELRRFADVCMDFSVSYRNIQDDRQFLTAENKSLKDELEARIAEVDFLGKELREIREENDDLIRKLECFNVNSDEKISIASDSIRPRVYAVVNSMPVFPRRFSEAVGYEPPASSASCHQPNFSLDTLDSSADLAAPIECNQSDKTQNILTPPDAFIKTSNQIDGCNDESSVTISPNLSGDETAQTIPICDSARSHSRDDISLYAHLFNDSNHQLGVLIDDQINDRSPSMDNIYQNQMNLINPRQIICQTNDASHSLSTAISSSAGTFYDCCNQIRKMFGVETNGDRKEEKRVASRMSNDNQCQSRTSSSMSQELTSLFNQTTRDHTPNQTSPMIECQEISSKSPQSIHSDQCRDFLLKTPSPNSYSFDDHFDKYRSEKIQDTSKNSPLFFENDEDDGFLNNAPPVQRYNSKKITKKRKSHKRNEQEHRIENESTKLSLISVPIPVSVSASDPCESMLLLENAPKIPTPQIDLNRYLLVEVSHIISPGHFYLIVNDEKIGTNAFEDFLERFQTFYKSIEDLHPHRNRYNDDNDDDEHELRMLVSLPPPLQALTIGSFWACYIDDELDWRRVQIVGHSERKADEIAQTDGLIVVRDVDSGYSSTVHSQLIRPLTEEMAKVPAFAVHASLAFIYPFVNKNLSSLNDCSKAQEYYEEWPMDCCQFFEDMTYDQILTASVIQINREESSETEIIQVLLWCTSPEDVEIFINKKMIELNYASNVADDDLWMEQFSESGLINPIQNVSDPNQKPISRPDSPNVETIFTIQLPKISNINPVMTTESFHSDEPSKSLDHSILDNQMKKNRNEVDRNETNQMPSTSNKNHNENDQNSPTGKKLKLKTRSKKKKDSNDTTRDEKKGSQEPVKSSLRTETDRQPAASVAATVSITSVMIETNQLQSPSSPLSKENKIVELCPPSPTPSSLSSSSSNPSPMPSPYNITASSSSIDFNDLLSLSIEPAIIVSFVNDCDCNNDGQIDEDDGNEQQDYDQEQSLIEHYCRTLHHDPRLSNWIVQKHSRHVTLKSLDKISYLFRITCYFGPNKFIGTLPFGERRLDTETIKRFIQNSKNQNCPLRQFVNEMTQFYQKLQENDSTKLRLLPEQCVFEQANSSTIVFYEANTGRYLRGHIVGRDMISNNPSDPLSSHRSSLQQSNLNTSRIDPSNGNTNVQSKSVKDLLQVPDDCSWKDQRSKKTLSLKRRTMNDRILYLIYSIDLGRYFQTPLKHIYHLDDRFKMTKPFAIVCKLHSNVYGRSKQRNLQRLIESRRFFGLRFLNIDFSSERFQIELFSPNENSTMKNNQSQSQFQFINLIDLI